MNNALILYYLRKIKYVKDKNDSLYVPVIMTHADIGTCNEKDKLHNEFMMLYELLYNSGVLPDIKEYEEFLKDKHNKIAEMNKGIGVGLPLLMDCDPYKLDFFKPYIEKYEELVKDGGCMTEKRFKFCSDTVARNLKTPIVYDGEKMSIGEVLDKLNELREENEQLKSILKEMLRISEYNGAISPVRVKSMVRNFVEDSE